MESDRSVLAAREPKTVVPGRDVAMAADLPRHPRERISVWSISPTVGRLCGRGSRSATRCQCVQVRPNPSEYLLKRVSLGHRDDYATDAHTHTRPDLE